MSDEKLLSYIDNLTVVKSCYSTMYFNLRDYLKSTGLSYQDIDKIADPDGGLRDEIKLSQNNRSAFRADL